VGFIVGIAVGGIVGGFLGLGLLCPSIIDSTRLRTTRENIIFILSLMMELWQP
jgi:gas vesicle protein